MLIKCTTLEMKRERGRDVKEEYPQVKNGHIKTDYQCDYLSVSNLFKVLVLQEEEVWVVPVSPPFQHVFMPQPIMNYKEKQSR